MAMNNGRARLEQWMKMSDISSRRAEKNVKCFTWSTGESAGRLLSAGGSSGSNNDTDEQQQQQNNKKSRTESMFE